VKRINQRWQENRIEDINCYLETKHLPEPVITSFNLAAQWYIMELLKNDIPHIVINRGAGVKEIVIQKIKCTYCRGKGYL
jgi:hypothetical protein